MTRHSVPWDQTVKLCNPAWSTNARVDVKHCLASIHPSIHTERITLAEDNGQPLSVCLLFFFFPLDAATSLSL